MIGRIACAIAGGVMAAAASLLLALAAGAENVVAALGAFCLGAAGVGLLAWSLGDGGDD